MYLNSNPIGTCTRTIYTRLSHSSTTALGSRLRQFLTYPISVPGCSSTCSIIRTRTTKHLATRRSRSTCVHSHQVLTRNAFSIHPPRKLRSLLRQLNILNYHHILIAGSPVVKLHRALSHLNILRKFSNVVTNTTGPNK